MLLFEEELEKFFEKDYNEDKKNKKKLIRNKNLNVKEVDSSKLLSVHAFMKELVTYNID